MLYLSVKTGCYVNELHREVHTIPICACLHLSNILYTAPKYLSRTSGMSAAEAMVMIKSANLPVTPIGSISITYLLCREILWCVPKMTSVAMSLVSIVSIPRISRHDKE